MFKPKSKFYRELDERCQKAEFDRITGTKEKSPVEGNLTRATRKPGTCDRCEKPLTGKQERFCSDRCRYALRNKIRYQKQKLAVMLAYRVEELIPTIRRLAEEIVDLHEVKKKGG